eukprot:1288117-Heterocapsa_arctica.AAC.1
MPKGVAPEELEEDVPSAEPTRSFKCCGLSGIHRHAKWGLHIILTLGKFCLRARARIPSRGRTLGLSCPEDQSRGLTL